MLALRRGFRKRTLRPRDAGCLLARGRSALARRSVRGDPLECGSRAAQRLFDHAVVDESERVLGRGVIASHRASIATGVCPPVRAAQRVIEVLDAEGLVRHSLRWRP